MNMQKFAASQNFWNKQTYGYFNGVNVNNTVPFA